MFEVRTVRTIDAGAPLLWTILADEFADVANWASPVDESSMNAGVFAVGAERTVTYGGKQSTETVAVVDPETMAMAYDVTGGRPSFLTSARSQWTVTPDGDCCCSVESLVLAELAWWLRPAQPVIRVLFGRGAGKILQDLAAYTQLRTT